MRVNLVRPIIPVKAKQERNLLVLKDMWEVATTPELAAEVELLKLAEVLARDGPAISRKEFG